MDNTMLNLWLLGFKILPEDVLDDERLQQHIKEKDGRAAHDQLVSVCYNRGFSNQASEIQDPAVMLEFISLISTGKPLIFKR